MPTTASDAHPVVGRVDPSGRLVMADPPLERLQADAGGTVGERLMIPQLASLARQALRLGVPLSRSVLAAGHLVDLDLRVRAEISEGDVLLKIERWIERHPAPPRLTLVVNAGPGDGRATGMPAAPSPAEFHVNAQLRLLSMNDSARAWLDVDGHDDAIGQPLTRWLKMIPDDEGEFALLDALSNETDFGGQRAAPRGLGDIAPRTLSGVVQRDDDGRLRGFILSVTGHTEDRAAAPAPALDPALDEALRSPVERIIHAAERIVERADGPLRSDYATYASDIAAAGRHLQSVIRSMSLSGTPPGAPSNADSGGRNRVPLAPLVAEAMVLVQAQAGPREIDLRYDEPDDDLTALGDRRGVVQVLVNILGNAVRHSPERGTVTVSGRRDADTVTISVTDDGPGIAPDDQQRIFERYQRLDDDDSGTGLGLAISRRLARSMGGDILLASAPGEGARFTLVLPAA